MANTIHQRSGCQPFCQTANSGQRKMLFVGYSVHQRWRGYHGIVSEIIESDPIIINVSGISIQACHLYFSAMKSVPQQPFQPSRYMLSDYGHASSVDNSSLSKAQTNVKNLASAGYNTLCMKIYEESRNASAMPQLDSWRWLPPNPVIFNRWCRLIAVALDFELAADLVEVTTSTT